jgi:hypothetical protein
LPKTQKTAKCSGFAQKKTLYFVVYLVEHRGFELLLGVAVWSFLVRFATVLLVKTP